MQESLPSSTPSKSVYVDCPAKPINPALAIGMPVLVSDGQPRPKSRHTRQLAVWRRDNFAGYVVELDARGFATVEVPLSNGWSRAFRIFRSGLAQTRLAPIPGLETVTLGTGMRKAVSLDDPRTQQMVDHIAREQASDRL